MAPATAPLNMSKPHVGGPPLSRAAGHQLPVASAFYGVGKAAERDWRVAAGKLQLPSSAPRRPHLAELVWGPHTAFSHMPTVGSQIPPVQESHPFLVFTTKCFQNPKQYAELRKIRDKAVISCCNKLTENISTIKLITHLLHAHWVQHLGEKHTGICSGKGFGGEWREVRWGAVEGEAQGNSSKPSKEKHLPKHQGLPYKK